MRIDFYRVEMPNGASPFNAILKAVQDSPDDASRAKEIAGDYYRLQSLATRQSRFYEGEIIRIRPDEPTLLGTLAGKVEVLPLKPNQGPCSETAFLYDRTTQALLIQVHRAGVLAASLAKYCEVTGDIDGAIVTSMIPHQEFVKQLGRVRKAQKFKVRFAGIENPTLLVGHGPGKTEAVALLKESTAPKVEITISLGHGPRDRTLNVKDVIASAKRFFGISQHEAQAAVVVDAVEVIGKDDHDSPVHLNMLKFAMSERADIAPGKDKRLAYDQRRDAIREAWDKRHADVESIYPPD
jgi:hypothetical protein